GGLFKLDQDRGRQPPHGRARVNFVHTSTQQPACRAAERALRAAQGMKGSAHVRRQLSALNQLWLELMSEGRFAEAWLVSDRAQELHLRIDCASWPRDQQFVWNGEPRAGKHVLVRCYRGLGDTVQFVRLVSRLRESASAVTLWAQPLLVPLLHSVRG